MRVALSSTLIILLLGAIGAAAESASKNSTHAIEPGSYEAALVDAICHWAQEGNHDDALINLRTVLDKHPELVNAPRAFRQPRKPVRNDDYAPLHFAVQTDNADTVAYLLDKGANVNIDGGGGWTPLHMAAQNGSLAIVKLLVAHGADINAKTALIPESSSANMPSPPPPIPGQPRKPPTIYPAIPANSALDLARKNKHRDVVQYLESIAQ